MWRDKLIECIDNYQSDLIWHDSGLGGMPGRPLEKGAGSIQESYIKEYLAYYFNKAKDWGKDVAVTYKQNDLPPEVGILDHERGRESSLTKHVWLTDDSGGGWFHKNDAYRDSDWLVKHLIEIVCRNGCLLLNIPPRPDGTFSKQVEECLRGTGDWLSVNGEAIYGTRPWKTCMEKTSRQAYSSDMRFTRSKSGDTVYVICLEWPGKELKVTSLRDDCWMCPSEIKQVKMLGTDEKLKWSRDEVFLRVALPEKHTYKHAFVIKVEFKDKITN